MSNLILNGISAASLFATMDPTYHTGNGWSLSGGNLIVGATSVSFGQQRSTTSHATGQHYFEATFTTIPNGCLVGIIQSADTSGNWPGKSSTSYGILANSTTSAQGKHNSAVWPGTSWSATFTHGDTIGFALDSSANTVSIYKNGTLITPSAISIVSGAYYAAVGIPNSGSGPNTLTMNFGQSPYAIPGGMPPAGYSNW